MSSVISPLPPGEKLPRVSFARFFRGRRAVLSAALSWVVVGGSAPAAQHPARPPSAPVRPTPAPTPAPEKIVPAVTDAGQRFDDLFQPLRTQLAALSPDGKLLAYTVREGSTLSVVILEVDKPSAIKTKINVLTDEDATPMLHDTAERTPAAIRWLRWATSNRLVAETNAQQPDKKKNENWKSYPGAIVAFDADGSQARTLVTPRDVAMLQPPLLLPSSTSLIPTPDQDPVAAAAGLPTLFGGDPTTPDPVDLGTGLSRAPRAIDFIPGNPVSLLIRAEGAPNEFNLRTSERFKVDLEKGKLKSLGEEIDAHGFATLLDRQGERRLTVPNTTQRPFPHAFTYDSALGNVRAKPLDALAGFTSGPGFSVSPGNYFGERAVPVGFDENPDILYFASNIGRDTYGIYGLDLTTGKRTDVAFESPTLDLFEPVPEGFADPALLVFDRFTRKLAGIRINDKLPTTRWVHPEWQAMQTLLEKSLPGRAVEIQDWDQEGRRFLVLAHGPTDPGAIYIFERATGKLSEFIRRAPDLDTSKVNPPFTFAFKSPAGGDISGVLTVPHAARLRPVPVVVLCQSEPWLRVPSTYQPAVLALAEMGVFVVQVNARSVWGSGRHQRELAKDGFEESQVGDIVATLDWLSQRFDVSLKRVAIMGERRGAYLALRALQLRPNRFRCAFALEPTIDLGGWLAETRWDGASSGPVLTRGFYGSAEHLAAAPLIKHPEAIKGAVLLMAYRGAFGAPETLAHANAQRFEKAMSREGATAHLSELNEDYVQGLPHAKAAVFREIEDFLNENLYNFRVDVGDLKEKSE